MKYSKAGKQRKIQLFEKVVDLVDNRFTMKYTLVDNKFTI